jgi:hypothetical protein
MADTTQLAFRFSAALIARIDAHVARLKAEAPWSNPTRAMAVRLLVTDALDAAEKKSGKLAKTTRGKRA